MGMQESGDGTTGSWCWLCLWCTIAAIVVVITSLVVLVENIKWSDNNIVVKWRYSGKTELCYGVKSPEDLAEEQGSMTITHGANEVNISYGPRDGLFGMSKKE